VHQVRVPQRVRPAFRVQRRVLHPLDAQVPWQASLDGPLRLGAWAPWQVSLDGPLPLDAQVPWQVRPQVPLVLRGPRVPQEPWGPLHEPAER